MEATSLFSMGAVNYRHLPVVSIIIPTYKRPHLVPQAIQSALSQTYRRCEVIVVDDESPDDTAVVVQAFAPRVRYIRQEHGGVERAMNTGVAAAVGDFFCFLGDDDLLHETAIEREVALMMADQSVGIVFGRSELRDLDGNFIQMLDPSYERAPGIVPGVVELTHLGIKNYITGAATLIRREAWNQVGGFNPACEGVCEDWDLWVRIACHWSVGYIPDFVQTVRVTPGHLLSQITGKRIWRLLRNHRRIIDTIYTDPVVGPALLPMRSRIEAGWNMAYAVAAYYAGDFGGARRHYDEAVRLYPQVLSDPEIEGAERLKRRLFVPPFVVEAVRIVKKLTGREMPSYVREDG